MNPLSMVKTSPVPPLDEQRRIVAHLDGLPPSLRFGDRQAKVNAFPLAAKRLGDDVREPHKGVILQVKGGAPKGVLREGVAPVPRSGADADIMPEGCIVPLWDGFDT